MAETYYGDGSKIYWACWLITDVLLSVRRVEELKRRLVSAPILTLPSVSGVFKIYNHKESQIYFLLSENLTYTRRWLELRKDYDTNIQLPTERLDVELCVRGSDGYWASMRIESNLMLQIKETQRDDGELWAIVQNVEDGKHTEFSVD
ncbi:hypothetical protein Tco_0901602 [Tanacetum coccineum]